MSDNSEKEKKYKYYFWLDEMIMDLWSEYIDYIIDQKPIELCENKLKLIEFYQSEIDNLAKDISFQEAVDWLKKIKSPRPPKHYMKSFLVFLYKRNRKHKRKRFFFT